MVTVIERDIEDSKDWRSVIPKLTGSLLETIKEDQPWYVKVFNWMETKYNMLKFIS